VHDVEKRVDRADLAARLLRRALTDAGWERLAGLVIIDATAGATATAGLLAMRPDEARDLASTLSLRAIS